MKHSENEAIAVNDSRSELDVAIKVADLLTSISQNSTADDANDLSFFALIAHVTKLPARI